MPNELHFWGLLTFLAHFAPLEANLVQILQSAPLKQGTVVTETLTCHSERYLTDLLLPLTVCEENRVNQFIPSLNISDLQVARRGVETQSTLKLPEPFCVAISAPECCDPGVVVVYGPRYLGDVPGWIGSRG